MKRQDSMKMEKHNDRQQAWEIRKAREAGIRRSVESVGSANGWLKSGYAGMNESIFFCPGILH